jgi:hypothetical protein
MRYRLRSLLILLGIAPPLLAAGWFVGSVAVSNYLARRDRDGEWINVGGLGSIAGFEMNISCSFGETEEINCESATETPPPAIIATPILEDLGDSSTN